MTYSPATRPDARVCLEDLAHSAAALADIARVALRHAEPADGRLPDWPAGELASEFANVASALGGLHPDVVARVAGYRFGGGSAVWAGVPLSDD